MDPQLQIKVAVLSGSTYGIGKAIASRLATVGARIIINGRTQKRRTL